MRIYDVQFLVATDKHVNRSEPRATFLCSFPPPFECCRHCLIRCEAHAFAPPRILIAKILAVVVEAHFARVPSLDFAVSHPRLLAVHDSYGSSLHLQRNFLPVGLLGKSPEVLRRQ